ncbi:putative cytochrome P450 CYP44 [Oratosquilla oratoria]|uniref:putative cytochrome P450 CYP44 n=1 Tax=Oratosquilla oratoria TaxID=337810 RepID=UPI003F7648EB
MMRLRTCSHYLVADLKQLNIRHRSTVAALLNTDRAKPFQSIPGPPSFPLIGCLAPYYLGLKNTTDYHKDVEKLRKKYGPIVKEVLGPQTIIHLFDPDDIKAVYNQDGKMPYIHFLQDTTEMYRKNNEMSPGLGNVNGEVWYRLRHAVHQMMLRPKEVSYYLPLQDGVACEAMERLEEERDAQGHVANLEDFVGKWIHESSAMCVFETSLKSLDKGVGEAQAQSLLDTNKQIFNISGHLKFSLKLYRYFWTPKYRNLHHLEDYFYGVCTTYIDNALKDIEELIRKKQFKEGSYSFLTYLMSRSDLERKDVIAIALSLFTDSLSTTVPTLLGNLLCLALNPESQERLYKEVISVVDPDGPMTIQHLNKLHYVKAFVKETFRFFPIGESVQRILKKDMELSGYYLPEGTCVDLNGNILLRDPDYFEDPDTFRPERWLRSKDWNPANHPYIPTPFSMGTRMCAGRRFAEQDLYIGLCRIILKYQLTTANYQTPEQEWAVLLRPKTPLPVLFHRR